MKSTLMTRCSTALRLMCLAGLAVSSSLAINSNDDPRPPPCPSPIYCHGPLLHTVQMNSPYHDSKTFVDMKMKYSENETLRLFDVMMNETNQNPSKTDIEVFLNDTFEKEGSEFEPWDPTDWTAEPAFLNKVKDPTLRGFGSDLNDLWKVLGRKVKEDVKLNPQQYSLIYVPNPVIVPGGRFREFYYWDSYWIVKGLLHSEMYSTVKGMLENFISIVDTFGFIPNGGRIYYERRSQPPLLIPMVQDYYQVTKDEKFVKDNIGTLEREFDFWMTNHTVKVEKNGVVYTLARYGDVSKGPRPESYSEDYETAHVFTTYRDIENYYSELKAAAESGWDFSSRWFIKDGTNEGNLTNLKTRSIVPVDLNAMIYWNAKILAEFYHMLGNESKAKLYEAKAEEWQVAVTEVLWHEETGVWLDYDILNEKKRDYFFPSNIAPLWTGCYDKANQEEIVTLVMKYLQKMQITVNIGGIPASQVHTNEQWDYPNAWPPLQHMMIIGLDNTGDSYAKKLASEMAQQWVRANYIGYEKNDAMFEKYDATIPGGYGGGGEYELQLGFGWTNGVILDLLVKYGDELTAEEPDVGESNQNNGVSTVTHSALPAMLCTGLVMASCIGAFAYKKRSALLAGRFCPEFCDGYMELRNSRL